MEQRQMQPYNRYTTQDFIKDDDFCRWVVKGSTADNLFWENWLRQNPESRDRVEMARSLVHSVRDAHNYLSDGDMEVELTRIAKMKGSSSSRRIGRFSIPNHFYKYAAAIAMVALASVFYFSGAGNSAAPFAHFPESEKVGLMGGGFVEISNDELKPKLIELEDGSKITLRPKSWIRYPKTFASDSRKVYLTGEAFFEVSKNPFRPFVVTTSDLVTTVLGTSFTVKSFEDDQNSSVQVRTGKVTVSSSDNSSSDSKNGAHVVVLLPNQQVNFSRKDQRLVRTLVDNPLPIENVQLPELDMEFEDAAVTTVFDVLKKQYGVQIICDEEMLAECQLNAQLGKEPLMEKIEMICTAIKATYEVIDGQIIIKGSNCGAYNLKTK
jgi:transmembrane sensor